MVHQIPTAVDLERGSGRHGLEVDGHEDERRSSRGGGERVGVLYISSLGAARPSSERSSHVAVALRLFLGCSATGRRALGHVPSGKLIRTPVGARTRRPSSSRTRLSSAWTRPSTAWTGAVDLLVPGRRPLGPGPSSSRTSLSSAWTQAAEFSDQPVEWWTCWPSILLVPGVDPSWSWPSISWSRAVDLLVPGRRPLGPGPSTSWSRAVDLLVPGRRSLGPGPSISWSRAVDLLVPGRRPLARAVDCSAILRRHRVSKLDLGDHREMSTVVDHQPSSTVEIAIG